MSPQRVLLTGGAGFIGSTIARLLLTEHDDIAEVVVLDDFSRGTFANLGEAAGDPRLTVVRGDVRDYDTVSEALRDVDAVFHLAAIRITRCADEPFVALDVLAKGTLNVIEAARMRGVRKIVASSSASVYGLAEQFPTREDHHPYGDRTLYGAAKAFNEGMLRAAYDLHGQDYVALRYFNVYGPGMDRVGKYTEVFIRWMQAIEAGEAPQIHGDGSTSMDLVFVEDIARANIAAWRSDVTDEVFNVGTGRETTLAQLAFALADVMGSEIRPEFVPGRKVNGVTRRLADVSKAERLLGFTASVSLEEGLARLVDWYRSGVAAPEQLLATV